MTGTPTDWIGFWDGAPTVYVSDRHKRVHYRAIAEGIAERLPPQARVLDFGCGEALDAAYIADRAKHLYLCDAAITVRDGLDARFHDHPKIVVVSPEDLGQLEAGSLDIIVVNSVAQYLAPDELGRNVEVFKTLLAPDGHILFADIIPPDVGAVTDATQLLVLASKHGFTRAALLGLTRTLFSDYRKIRGELGLTRYSEAEFETFARERGLEVERTYPNLGHNQRRMAFKARVTAA